MEQHKDKRQMFMLFLNTTLLLSIRNAKVKYSIKYVFFGSEAIQYLLKTFCYLVLGSKQKAAFQLSTPTMFHLFLHAYLHYNLLARKDFCIFMGKIIERRP